MVDTCPMDVNTFATLTYLRPILDLELRTGSMSCAMTRGVLLAPLAPMLGLLHYEETDSLTQVHALDEDLDLHGFEQLQTLEIMQRTFIGSLNYVRTGVLGGCTPVPLVREEARLMQQLRSSLRCLKLRDTCPDQFYIPQTGYIPWLEALECFWTI